MQETTVHAAISGEVDTSATTEIHASPLKTALMGLGCVGFVIAGCYLATSTVGTGPYPPVALNIVGYASILFFGLCGIIWLKRALATRGPVIALSPQGLTDHRVSHDIIPWPAVHSLSTWKHSGQSILVIGLKPGEEQKLRLTAIARMTRKANTALGADGLSIVATGSKVSFDRLMELASAYLARYGN
jgi:hypothetical protein